MNILVTGANGQLGNEIRIVSAASEDSYIFTDVADSSEESIAMLRKLAGDKISHDTLKLDITDIDAIRKMVKDNDIKVIINCAAFTNVDAAEDKAEFAELLNAAAPGHLALAMKEVRGVLFHISTDYVFGANSYNTPCSEDQQGTPSGVYGLTKLHGEQAIEASGCEYVIVRTAWLYSEFGKNFVKTMLSLTSSKPSLKVVFDQVGTPTYALDLARVLYSLITERAYKGHSGIYHYSDEGVCSWYDFTKMIASLSGHNACDIQPCHSDEFPSKVIRPAFSVLDKTKIKQTFGLSIPYWLDSLKVCINNY